MRASVLGWRLRASPRRMSLAPEPRVEASARRAASRHDVHPHSEECRMGTASRSQSSTMVESGPDAARLAETGSQSVSVTVNGLVRTIMVEPRMTLLDALREELALTGTKKGCDRGECGACTVHVEGRRVLSCMTLAVMQEGKRITTIEGLERNGRLHPLQAAFIEHDGFQCGFCTSGQIMSGVAVIEEAKRGWPSAATTDVRRRVKLADLSDLEIRERMSGNLCRCACYPN